MIGSKYKLFGTSTIFEINAEDGDDWIITVLSDSNDELGINMKKEDLNDGIKNDKLVQI